MTTHKTLLLAVVLLAAFTHCKKKHASTDTGNSAYGSILDYMSNLRYPAQTFTINAGTGGTITGLNGTKITFDANTLIHQNGTLVKGNVTVQLIEVFSKMDMIFNNVLPVSDGNPLISGGEYYLSAVQNYEQLKLKPGQYYHVKLPAQAKDTGMQMFLGPAGIAANVNWKPNINHRIAIDSTHYYQHPLQGFAYRDSIYKVDCDSLGWGNADQFMSNPNYINFKMYITGLTNISSLNTSVYASYDGHHTVWPTGSYSWEGGISNDTVTDKHIATIPIHFIVMTVSGDSLYVGTLAATPAAGTIYTVNVVPMSKSKLATLLKGLN